MRKPTVPVGATDVGRAGVKHHVIRLNPTPPADEATMLQSLYSGGVTDYPPHGFTEVQTHGCSPSRATDWTPRLFGFATVSRHWQD